MPSSTHSRRGESGIRGLGSYRLTPRIDDPALVLGYGRIPLASIDAAVAALAEVLT